MSVAFLQALQSCRNIMTYTELPSAKATTSRKTCLFETVLDSTRIIDKLSSTSIHRIGSIWRRWEGVIYIYQNWVYHFPGCFYMKHPFTKCFFLHWPQDVLHVYKWRIEIYDRWNYITVDWNYVINGCEKITKTSCFAQAELLIVDEAAAIPLPIVKKLLGCGWHCWEALLTYQMFRLCVLFR